MPTYCYTTDDGDTVERDYPLSRKRPASIRLTDGRVARRDLVAERRGASRCVGQWPILSDALGVHPDQIPEAMAFGRKHGVNIEFVPDGRAKVFPDTRKKWAEINGIYDRNGGYSDPQRK